MNGQPAAALTGGPDESNGALSYLPGQRLSACTCPGESHPGPKHPDGSFVGRSAPEIDMFEAQVKGTPLQGQVSQSAQWAPFNHDYVWLNTSDNMVFDDPSITVQNTYTGGDTQQATSVVTNTNQGCYELDDQCFSVYGFEYTPGYDQNVGICFCSVIGWLLNWLYSTLPGFPITRWHGG
jgi:beta-glucan synthesis-associated protein KRE6